MKLHKCCGTEPELILSRNEDCCFAEIRCKDCGRSTDEYKHVFGGTELIFQVSIGWNLMFEKVKGFECDNCRFLGSSSFDCVSSEPSECYFCGEPRYPLWELSK